jgi:hypothetical protein
MGLSPCLAVNGGSEAMAFRAKENGGLIVDGQEYLGLFC